MVNEKRLTNVDWVFACGNVLQVHDLVDNVTEEAEIAGKAAAELIAGKLQKREQSVTVKAVENIGYVVPQRIDYVTEEKLVKLYMRVRKPDENVLMVVRDEKGEIIAKYKKETIAPGSMVALSVPAAKINGTASLTVSVESQEE